MEAKKWEDTVMNDKQLARAFNSCGDELISSNWDLHCPDDLRDLAKAQAKRTETMLKGQWKQEGIREVVEFVLAHKETSLFNKHGNIYIEPKEWQAFLQDKFKDNPELLEEWKINSNPEERLKTGFQASEEME